MKSKTGFSLIEMCMALGIATFAIIALFSLLPVSLGSARDAVQETEALGILREVVADRDATPANADSSLYGLPAFSSANTAEITGAFGVLDNHQTSADFDQSRWRVTYTIYPLQSPEAPFLAHIRVSWPAADTNAVNAVESVATFPQP